MVVMVVEVWGIGSLPLCQLLLLLLLMLLFNEQPAGGAVVTVDIPAIVIPLALLLLA